MTAEEIFAKIDALQPLAERDLRTVPMASQQAAAMSIRTAQNDIARLRNEYNAQLETLLKVKVLTTADTAAFDTLFDGSETNVLGVNGGEMYEAFTKVIWPTVGSRSEFNLHQVFTLNGLVKEVTDAFKLNFESLEGPYQSGINTEADALSAIRACIQHKYGNNLLVNTLTKKVQDTAFAARITEPTALVITNLKDDEFSDINSKVFSNAALLTALPLKSGGLKDGKKLVEKITTLLAE